MQSSAVMRGHAAAGKIVVGVNHEMRDFATGRKQDLDLVIVSSPMSTTRTAVRRGIDVGMRHTLRLVLAREVARLRLRGIPVVAFQPDSPSGWTLLGKLTPSDATAGTVFGEVLDVSGDLLAVGDYANDERGSDAGAAYVFEREGGFWTESAKLAPPELEAGEQSVGVGEVAHDFADGFGQLADECGHGQDLVVGRSAWVLLQIHDFDLVSPRQVLLAGALQVLDCKLALGRAIGDIEAQLPELSISSAR